MIKELAEFGKRIRKGHDALKDEPIGIDLVIGEDGSFIRFSVIEKIFRPAEAINAKKGKARLLLDKAEEVLEYIGNEKNKHLKKGTPEDKAIEEAVNAVKSKHKLFLDKLNDYKHLPLLEPVFKFYYDNKDNGLKKALEAFEQQVEEKERIGNIAFRVNDIRLHEQTEVLDAIIKNYEKKQCIDLKEQKKVCYICGTSNFPVKDEPHGMIKRVPDGQSSGCALVSYNENAFESYDLKGNDNSSICTNCAKNYVEGLNWLMNNDNEISAEIKGKTKKQFKYTNRKNFGSDTAMIFWTREPENLPEMDWFDKPDEGQVANLIESVTNAKNAVVKNFQSNQFYSLTLSGAAARIAVRDWIEVSMDEYRYNIARWFEDIRIAYYDSEIKKIKIFYPSLNQLAWACNRQGVSDDPTISRVAKHLWNCALKNQIPPLWILQVILKRIAHNETNPEGKQINTFTTPRASLIRFLLNRNNIGGIKMKEELDFENNSPAYLCGRLFALIEGIQRAALGKEINAGIRERFFSAASTSPSPTFGRLMRLMQNHLTKIRQEKPGLAVVLDKEVVELCGRIHTFPAILSLEQQGQFALGYYHQKHYDFNRSRQNKEFESLTENMEEQDYE